MTQDTGAGMVINVPAVGEPELPPLSDGNLGLILCGLLNPSQGAGKSMARELIAARATLARKTTP